MVGNKRKMIPEMKEKARRRKNCANNNKLGGKRDEAIEKCERYVNRID